MNKFIKNISIWVVAICIGAFLIGPVIAQGSVQVGKKKVDITAAMRDFTSRLDRDTAILTGPFDIVVFPTDKSNGGHKYSKVPYIQLLSGNLIIFPSGEKEDRFGNGTFVYSINYTIETKRKIVATEKSRK